MDSFRYSDELSLFFESDGSGNEIILNFPNQTVQIYAVIADSLVVNAGIV